MGTGTTKTVFLSVPMRGYTTDQIRNRLNEMKAAFLLKNYSEFSEVEFIDNLIEEDLSGADYKNVYMAYLAEAIRKMATCDAIFFSKGFEDARGCLAEDYIAAHYGLARYYEEEDKDDIDYNIKDDPTVKEYITNLINTSMNLGDSVRDYLNEKHHISEVKTPVVKIKFHKEGIHLEQHGNFFDLVTAEDVHIEPMSFAMINLGVSMKLPDGYWGQLVPRSSTFKKYNIIQTNSFGVIDTSYCGDNDIWMMPVFNLSQHSRVDIPAFTRICQFRIVKDNPFEFEEVDMLTDPDRGGFGSTGN